jgi:hypothetical protein
MPTVLRTVLTNLTPVSVDLAAGRITLSGASRYADSARGRHGQIVDVCRRELGQTIEIIIQSEDVPADEPASESAEPSVSSGDSPRPADQSPSAATDAESTADDAPGASPAPPRTPPMMPSQHPLVKEAMELFGARIVDVQHRRPSA